VNIADAGIGKTGDQLGGMIGRAVVNHDDLEMGVILPEDRLNGEAEITGIVEGRNDDRDRREFAGGKVAFQSWFLLVTTRDAHTALGRP